MRSWISDYIHGSLWDVISYPCLNFNGGLVKPPLNFEHGWEIASHVVVTTYPCLNLTLTMYVKAASGSQTSCRCVIRDQVDCHHQEDPHSTLINGCSHKTMIALAKMLLHLSPAIWRTSWPRDIRVNVCMFVAKHQVCGRQVTCQKVTKWP